MKTALAFLLSVSLVVCSGAVAEGQPWQFEFLAAGGDVPDQGIGVFPLFMDNPHVPIILSIEMDIYGLTHTSPMDLDVYLIDPFGHTIEIMTDRGNQLPIAGVDLTFSDTASTVPPEAGPILPGTYMPEGLFMGTDIGFETYVGGSGGTDAWILLMIDDAAGDTGSFSQYRLRGWVPEPVTLSLLALGALVTLRRRRR